MKKKDLRYLTGGRVDVTVLAGPFLNVGDSSRNERLINIHPGVRRNFHSLQIAARKSGCEGLERGAVKVARSVLIRGYGSNPASLFD